jgi:NAD(P)-dependent dehydrogenase (short-subunit alcohol dehydrogenase family)
MATLSDKRIVVVGGSSGIGLATVRATAREGADVIMVSRNADKLEAAKHGIAGRVSSRAVDMLDVAAVHALLDELKFMDHLVLTAVANESKLRGRVVEITDETFERSLDKFRGFFHFVRAAAPKIRPSGSITITSGDSALKPPREGMSVLAAVNAAVATFSRALSLELAPVRVNAVSPGVVDTSVRSPAEREQVKAWAESAQLPAQHFGQPDDIAHAMIFLMTNPYVTGHLLVVDGGLVAT